MKKHVLSCVLPILLAVAFIHSPCAFAEVSENQWKEMLSEVGKEDWSKSYKLSAQFLKEMPESDARLPRLRYIVMYTAAGEVSAGQMSYDELSKVVEPLVGKAVVFPFRPLAVEAPGGALNLITGGKDDRKKLFSVASNQDGTTIHAFEYVTLKDEFDVARHDGEPASIGGVIDKITPNPNKSAALVLRVFVSQGTISLMDKKDFHPTQK